MIVCQCAVVTNRDLMAAVAGGAHTVREVCRVTGAARTCRTCAPAVEALVRQYLTEAGVDADQHHHRHHHRHR